MDLNHKWEKEGNAIFSIYNLTILTIFFLNLLLTKFNLKDYLL